MWCWPIRSGSAPGQPIWSGPATNSWPRPGWPRRPAAGRRSTWVPRPTEGWRRPWTWSGTPNCRSGGSRRSTPASGRRPAEARTGAAAADGEEPPVAAAPAYRGELAAAIEDARKRQAAGGSTVLVVAGAGTAARAGERLAEADIGVVVAGGALTEAPRTDVVTVACGRLENGFVLRDSGLAILTEADLTGTRGVNPDAAAAGCPPAGAMRSTRCRSSPVTTSCTPSTASASTSTWCSAPPAGPPASTWWSSTRPASAATRATGSSCRPTRSTCCPGTSAVRCRR